MISLLLVSQFCPFSILIDYWFEQFYKFDVTLCFCEDPMFWSVPMWVRVSDDILVTLTIAPESASMCGTTSSQPTIVMHNLTGTSLGGDFYMFCLYFYLGLGWVYSGLPLSYVASLPVTINVSSICRELQKYLVASELLWIILYVPSYLLYIKNKISLSYTATSINIHVVTLVYMLPLTCVMIMDWGMFRVVMRIL